MRVPAFIFGLAATMLPGLPGAAEGETSSVSVTVTASIGSRTWLTVSGHTLEFSVADPAQPAAASVDFSAAARTHAASEVVLSVEPLRALEGPGGAADVESSVTFDGQGEGTHDGIVAGAHPVVAGRWIGGGIRSGRLIFALRASAPGSYTLPVRFVLSAP